MPGASTCALAFARGRASPADNCFFFFDLNLKGEEELGPAVDGRARDREEGKTKVEGEAGLDGAELGLGLDLIDAGGESEGELGEYGDGFTLRVVNFPRGAIEVAIKSGEAKLSNDPER